MTTTGLGTTGGTCDRGIGGGGTGLCGGGGVGLDGLEGGGVGLGDDKGAGRDELENPDDGRLTPKLGPGLGREKELLELGRELELDPTRCPPEDRDIEL